MWEVSSKNLFQNKQVSWEVGEAWGTPKSRSAPAFGQMCFGWKPGFRRGKWLQEHRKKTWAGHSLPGLGSQTPLHSSADSAAALIWWRSLLCRHRREPCFSPTCWQFSEMQGTPGQKQASWSLKNPPYFLSFGKQNVAQETAPSASIFHIWSFVFTLCLNLCGSALYTEPGIVGCVSGKYFVMSIAGIPLSMFQCFW